MKKIWLFLILSFVMAACSWQPQEFTIINTLKSVEAGNYKGVTSVKLTFSGTYHYPDKGFNYGGDLWNDNTKSDIILIGEDCVTDFKELISHQIVLTVQPVNIDPPSGIKLAWGPQKVIKK